MATITSAQSGNFSDTATWVGGVVPGASDDAVAATGHTVAINVDTTVISVQQAGTGKFTLGNGRTLTGNVIANAGTFTSGGTVDVTATTTAVINGNVTGVSTTANNTAGVVVSGTGGLTINGSVTGSPGNGSSITNGSAAVYTNVTCTITINGAVTHGGNNKRGLQAGASSNGTFTIIGNVTQAVGDGGCVYLLGASPTLNITGTVTLNNGSSIGIAATGASPVVTITGDIVGPSGTFGTVIQINGSNSVLNITGNITFAVGSNNSSTGVTSTGVFATFSLTGSITAGLGDSAHGISYTGASSTVSVIGSANGAGVRSHGINSTATANGVIFQGDMTDSLNGAVAVYTRIFRMSATNSGVTTYTNTVGYPTGTPVSRVSPDNVTGMASQTDVRLNTVYGFNSELTGSLAVPPANAVGAGVPVDNTTGTAALSPADIAGLVGAQIAAAVSSP